MYKWEKNKMHRKTITIMFLVALLTFTAVPVLAIKPAGPSAKNGLEKGKNDHLYLYEKDSTDETWPIAEEPAWAKLNINKKQGKFVCNAHSLLAETEYSLICYQDPWPGDGSLLLATATSDETGNLHIKGTINYSELPTFAYDTDNDEVDDVIASKIWLVLASDFEVDDALLNTGYMGVWAPENYLFEFDLINKTPIFPLTP